MNKLDPNHREVFWNNAITDFKETPNFYDSHVITFYLK